jgi:hypothetical protein
MKKIKNNKKDLDKKSSKTKNEIKKEIGEKIDVLIKDSKSSKKRFEKIKKDLESKKIKTTNKAEKNEIDSKINSVDDVLGDLKSHVKRLKDKKPKKEKSKSKKSKPKKIRPPKKKTPEQEFIALIKEGKPSLEAFKVIFDNIQTGIFDSILELSPIFEFYITENNAMVWTKEENQILAHSNCEGELELVEDEKEKQIAVPYATIGGDCVFPLSKIKNKKSISYIKEMENSIITKISADIKEKLISAIVELGDFADKKHIFRYKNKKNKNSFFNFIINAFAKTPINIYGTFLLSQETKDILIKYKEDMKQQTSEEDGEYIIVQNSIDIIIENSVLYKNLALGEIYCLVYSPHGKPFGYAALRELMGVSSDKFVLGQPCYGYSVFCMLSYVIPNIQQVYKIIL